MKKKNFQLNKMETIHSFLKSHTLITTFTLCLVGFLNFWALEKNKCFAIRIQQKIIIEANCKINKG